MNKILFVIGMLTCSIAYGQEFIKVEGKNFEGYSISEEIPLLVGSLNRFTPNKEQILKLEDQLQSQIKSINQARPNQYKGCPVIDKKLGKYFRQYVGYINPDGNQIILANFIWKSKDFRDKISKGYLEVLDGCSRYWSIHYNLQTGEFFRFMVNGEG
jgi:hypothetical protein